MKNKTKSVTLWDERGGDGGFSKASNKKEVKSHALLPELAKEIKYCPVCERETEFSVIPVWGETKPRFTCGNCKIIITETKEECHSCRGVSQHYHYSTKDGKHRRVCPKTRLDMEIKLQKGSECTCGLGLR